jgi:hypothetical protein
MLVICVVAGLAGAASAGEGAPVPSGAEWIGADRGCSSGSYAWSTADNWQDCNPCPPTSGDIDIRAANVCDPCESCSCQITGCDPICEGVCVGGPKNGLGCSTTLDCDCCSGGSFVVDYDYDEEEEDYTFDDVWIYADSSSSVTLRKTDPDGGFATTGVMLLMGSGNNKAVLDVDANGFDIDRFESCGNVDITGVGTRSVDILTYFQAGFDGTGCDEDTVLTVTDGVDINVHAAAGDYTYVRSPTYNKATLVLDETEISVGALCIYGGGASSKEAKFQHDSPSTVTDLSSIAMRGYSWLDVNDSVNYGGSAPENRLTLTVDTNGAETVAKVDLDSAKTIYLSSISITSASDDNATLRPGSGTVDCSGTVTITGSSAGGSDAELEVQDLQALTMTLTNITLNERGVLDLDKSVAISGDLLLTADSDLGATPGAELQFYTGVVLTADAIKIDGAGSSVTFEPDFVSGAQVKTDGY